MQIDSEYSIVARDLSVAYSTLRVTRDRTSSNFLKRSGLIPSRTKKIAVRNVTFAVKRGEAVGIVGRNGSGKSSLLRALSGLEEPSTGEVWASTAPSFLGVSPALIPDRTGIENIRLGCLAMGMAPNAIEATMPKVIDLADLGTSIYDPINTYSSGMGARLRFAITAAAPESEILMIDEALGTGDAAFQARSEEAIADILGNAGTIFFVSHSPQVVERICSRAIWLYDGEVIMDGLAKEVPEYYRLWALAVKNGRDDEAAARIAEARLAYRPQRITVRHE